MSRQGKTRPGPKGVCWRDVDWEHDNSEIARQQGVSRERVRQARRLYAPEHLQMVPKPDNGRAFEILLKHGREVDWSAADEELARRFNLSEAVVRRARKAAAWRSVDWTLSNVEIAERMQVTPGCVARQRKAKAPADLKRSSGVRREAIDTVLWRSDAIDWSMTNASIARRLKVPIGVVREARKQRKWMHVDWKLHDDVIAEKLGLAKVTVRKARQRFAPKHLRIIHGTAKSEHLETVLMNRSLIDWEQEDEEIAARVGVPIGAIRRAREVCEWEKYDWTLTNAEIAREMGVTPQAMQMRRQLAAPEGLKQPPVKNTAAGRDGQSGQTPPPGADQSDTVGGGGAGQKGAVGIGLAAGRKQKQGSIE